MYVELELIIYMQFMTHSNQTAIMFEPFWLTDCKKCCIMLYVFECILFVFKYLSTLQRCEFLTGCIVTPLKAFTLPKTE
jgi:hypothetical protein